MVLNTKDLSSSSTSSLLSSMVQVPALTREDHLLNRQLLLTALDQHLPTVVISNSNLPSNLVTAARNRSMVHLSSTKATRDLHTRHLDLLTSSLCHGE